MLRDGRLLVIGGTGASGALASVEIVTLTASGATVSAAAVPLAAARGGHTATLLPDNRVFVTGGPDESTEYYTIAGTSPGPALSSPRWATARCSPEMARC